jgi:hypothetical protein
MTYTGCRTGSRHIGPHMQKQGNPIIGSPNNPTAKRLKWKLERIKSTVRFHSLSFSNTPWHRKKSKKGVKTKTPKSSTSNEIWLVKLFVGWFHYYLIFFWSALQMNSYRTTGRMKRYLPLNVQTPYFYM